MTAKTDAERQRALAVDACMRIALDMRNHDVVRMAAAKCAAAVHDALAAPSGVPQASKPQEGDDLAAARGEAPAAPMDELRRAAAVIAVVGQIDGYDVIRRESVLDIIDRRLP